MPALRQPLIAAPAALLALLAACGDDGADLVERPRAKPDEVSVTVARPDRKDGQSPMARARVSTRSGEILILEPDGSVSTMKLDSPKGRDVFRMTETQMAALRNGRDPVWSGLVADNVLKAEGPTAREKALEEFRAQSTPALPEWNGGTHISPEDFLGVSIALIDPRKAEDLVEVSARLREGVDADIAFSYATCALANWARDRRAPYARHIRTLQTKGNGVMTIGAAFTVSQERPLGLRVMETNDTLRECKDRGIPAA